MREEGTSNRAIRVGEGTMHGWAGQGAIIYMCEKVTLEPTPLYVEKLIRKKRGRDEGGRQGRKRRRSRECRQKSPS